MYHTNPLIEKIWVGQGSSLILFTGSTSSLEPESQQLEAAAAAAGGGKKSKLRRKKNWEEQTINTIKGDESNKKINIWQEKKVDKKIPKINSLDSMNILQYSMGPWLFPMSEHSNELNILSQLSVYSLLHLRIYNRSVWPSDESICIFHTYECV